jgi:hypothetical protein
MKWPPKREGALGGAIDRRTLNSFSLARLAMCDRLTPWERSFVRDVSQRRKLSPRQQEIVERLCREYLKETP